jgi:DNA-binding IclR family transcriptional regulator
MLLTTLPAPHPRQLSARLVARQVSELLLARSRRGLALVPQERLAGFVFEVVLSASIAHHPYRDAGTGRWVGVEDASTLGRPVSATAIALSMRLPHTTVRRRTAELVESGLLVRGKAGFSVAPSFFENGVLAHLAADDASDLARALRALADAGYAPATTALNAGVAALPPGVVERLLLAFSLRALETLTDLYGDVTAGTIVAAITAANVRGITADPQLAARYAEEDMPPPDTLREPISLRALSRAIDLPFETVRRRVRALVTQGIVVSKGDGVIVPARVLFGARHIENNRRIALHFEQLLQTLVLLTHIGSTAD